MQSTEKPLTLAVTLATNNQKIIKLPASSSVGFLGSLSFFIIQARLWLVLVWTLKHFFLFLLKLPSLPWQIWHKFFISFKEMLNFFIFKFLKRIIFVKENEEDLRFFEIFFLIIEFSNFGKHFLRLLPLK